MAITRLRWLDTGLLKFCLFMDQVTVVRRMDEAIQWLNVNKTNHAIPELDSDLSGG